MIFFYKKRNYIYTSILILLLIITFLPHSAFAINHFFNGIPTTLENINTPNDSYFGGSDTAINPGVTDSTTLIITGSDEKQSFFRSAYGGGISDQGIPNIIKGQSSLVIGNSNTSLIVGGSLSQGHVSIGGPIDVSVFNAGPLNVSGTIMPLTIYGGCQASTPMDTQSVDGSIFLNVSQTNAAKICGLGDAIGLAPNYIAVKDSVLIQLRGGSTQELIIAGEKKNVNLGGKAFLFAQNASINTLWATKAGNIGDSLSINLTSSSIGDFNLTESGTIGGTTTIIVDNSHITNLNLGPLGPIGVNAPVNLSISGPGKPGDFFSGASMVNLTCGPTQNGAFLATANVNLYSGNIVNLQLGSDVGITNNVNLVMRDGIVRNLIFGSRLPVSPPQQSNFVVDIRVDISGGTVEKLSTGRNVFSVLNFVGGGKSHILETQNVVNPNQIPLIHSVNLKKGCNTVWGKANTVFVLKALHATFDVDSRISFAPGASVLLFVGNSLAIDGGTLTPQAATPHSGPFLTISGEQNNALGVQPLSITVKRPLDVDLSNSPKLMGHKHIPIVMVDQSLAQSSLIYKKSCQGLFWTTCNFEDDTNTWYINKIEYSEDFYGISSTRKASSWLREQQTWNILNRSRQIFTHTTPGLWTDIQGGYERLNSPTSKSDMPWWMASIGYDILQPLTILPVQAQYGISLAFSEGRNRWSTVNKTKSAMYTGIANGYLGIMHTSGIYGIVTLQLAVNKNIAKTPGFDDINHTWTDIVPTEALEFGWKYTFSNGFTINPRGQIIFEQIPKNHIGLECGGDTEKLNNTLVTTSSLGFTGDYKLPLSVPTNIQASVEWMQGLSGDFGLTSKVLKKKFKDKNTASTFRATLGLTSKISKRFSLLFNIFGDIGNNKGFGGQAGLTYQF